MREFVKKYGTCFFLFLIPILLYGQEPLVKPDEPSWLTLERGRLAFDAREFGEALRLFREVKQSNSTMPEIDIEIGRVFEAEGEMDLALMQYERAYDRRELLLVPDDAVQLLYRIADIRYMRDEFLQYEQLLEQIVGEIDTRFVQPPTQLEEPMYRVISTDGLNKLLELYRVEDLGSQRAYHLLARTLLYEGRRFVEASKHAAFSVIMTTTELITYARYIDPEFQFTTIESLLGVLSRFRSVSSYIGESAYFDQLYVLGHALHGADRLSVAEDIRTMLVRVDPGGSAGVRAARGYPAL